MTRYPPETDDDTMSGNVGDLAEAVVGHRQEDQAVRTNAMTDTVTRAAETAAAAHTRAVEAPSVVKPAAAALEQRALTELEAAVVGAEVAAE